MDRRRLISVIHNEKIGNEAFLNATDRCLERRGLWGNLLVESLERRGSNIGVLREMAKKEGNRNKGRSSRAILSGIDGGYVA